MPHDLDYPISDPHLVLRACRAAEPLEPGDPRRYDFAPLRHAQVLPRLKKVFRGTPAEGDFHHRVLCGHRGCGKSTELLAFKDWADGDGFAEQGRTEAALAAIREALDHLEPFFRRHPAAFAPLMTSIIQDYEEAAEACGGLPDHERLDSIRALLRQVDEEA